MQTATYLSDLEKLYRKAKALNDEKPGFIDLRPSQKQSDFAAQVVLEEDEMFDFKDEFPLDSRKP
jgi:hypothetical protein